MTELPPSGIPELRTDPPAVSGDFAFALREVGAAVGDSRAERDQRRRQEIDHEWISEAVSEIDRIFRRKVVAVGE